MSTTALDSIGAPYVDRACPSWGCSLQYGHGWTDGWTDDDGNPEGEQFREHGRAVGAHVHLGCREHVDEPTDVSSTFQSATISVGDDREMTAEQARQLAVDLLKAADEVDRIEAGSA